MKREIMLIVFQDGSYVVEYGDKIAEPYRMVTMGNAVYEQKYGKKVKGMSHQWQDRGQTETIIPWRTASQKDYVKVQLEEF